MILCLDAGNTRTKWAVLDASAQVVESGVWLNQAWHEAQPAPIWQQCTAVSVCNVAGEAHAQRLAELLQAAGLSVYWLHASQHAAGIENRYQVPAQLGADRWAALIGAWHFYACTCLVVSAGTAFTVDALSANATGQSPQAIFWGGTISPGFSLMQQSLLQATAGIQHSHGDIVDFPQNTAQAISALTGAVQSMLSKLQQQTGMLPQVLLTGGDAALLLPYLQAACVDTRFILDPHLIVRGLWHMQTLRIESNAL
jgi:type III pantothenate kinase